MVYQRVSKPSSENSQIPPKDSASTVHKLPVQTKSDSASPQDQELPSYTPLSPDWATNNNLMKNLSGTQNQSIETGIIQRKSLKEKLKEHSNQVQEIIQRFKTGKTGISKLRDAVANIASKNKQIVKDIAQSDDGKAALKAMLKSMSSSTSKEAEKFGCLAIQAVFGIEKVEGFGGTALARLCSVLEKIPAKHINSTDNTSLKSLLRDKSSWLSKRGLGASTYTSHDREVKIAYGKATLGHTHGGADKVLRPLGAPFMSSPQSNLARENLFDQTVLHEIGHAVDDKFKIMNQYGKQSLFGGWQEHGSSPERDIKTASEGMPLPDTYNENIVKECLSAVLNGKQIKKIIESKVDSHNSSVKEEKKKNPDTSKKIVNKKDMINKYSAHPAIKAARIGGDKFSLQGAKGAWQMSDNALAEVALNGRVFHIAYGGTGHAYNNDWVSYELDARKHKVSMYQWRSPGEWFAEIYSHYFLNVLPKDHPVYGWIKECIAKNDDLNPVAIKSPTEWEKKKKEASESIKDTEEASESIKDTEGAEESIQDTGEASESIKDTEGAEESIQDTGEGENIVEIPDKE